MRVAHPRWGFDNLKRLGANSDKWGGNGNGSGITSGNVNVSKGLRTGSWVQGDEGNVRSSGAATHSTRDMIRNSKFNHMNREGAWDGTYFKLNLARTLHARLLLKMTFTAMRDEAKIGGERESLSQYTHTYTHTHMHTYTHTCHTRKLTLPHTTHHLQC